MPDIREVLAALDQNDRTLWQQHRTEMRRSYMTAHNSVLGLTQWSMEDDAFLDLIDIKLALLFDKSGRLQGEKTIVHATEASNIEQDIKNALSSHVGAGSPNTIKTNIDKMDQWGNTNNNNKE